MITDVALGCEWSSGITLTDTRMDVYEGMTDCIVSVRQRETTLAHCPVQVQQDSTPILEGGLSRERTAGAAFCSFLISVFPTHNCPAQCLEYDTFLTMFH